MISTRQIAGFIFLFALSVPAVAQSIATRIDLNPDPNVFDNRIITFDWLSAQGENVQAKDSINGPSMVYIPDGTPNKLGDYYLYFADHGGDHIKMAYGNSPTGPFTLYNPNNGVLTTTSAATNTFGTIDDRGENIRALYLNQSQTRAIGNHIASPDVLYDPDTGRYNMIYHGFIYNKQSDGTWQRGVQRSVAAWSDDGLNFQENQYNVVLDSPYLRHVRKSDGTYIGIGDNGAQVFPDDNDNPYTSEWNFPKIPRNTINDQFQDAIPIFDRSLFQPRHHAIKLDEESQTLTWFTTLRSEPLARVQDRGHSEVIYEITVDISGNDNGDWPVIDWQVLLEPELDYEGAFIFDGDGLAVRSGPGRPKQPGPNGATMLVNELRDPAYFFDPVSGREFLYYSVGGEFGIGVVELKPIPEPATAAIATVVGLLVLGRRRGRRHP